MKLIKKLTVGLLVFPVVLGMNAGAAPLLPGQVDFGQFTPANGAEFVDVNLPASLITLAAKFVEKQEPDVAKLLHGIKMVRVNVLGLTDQNRGEVEARVKAIRADLGSSGWERLVTVMNDGQDVGVYLKMDEKSIIQGLAVVVLDGKKQAVFVNIVGNIRPEQLTMLAERLQIEPLKNLVPAQKNDKVEKADR
jgi:hypothetical protein